MDRSLATLSTLMFFLGLCRTLWVLRGESRKTGRIDYLLNLAGFLALFGFLVVRGAGTRHCPVTNSFEVAMFVCWSLSLFYLVVGTSYRLSPLGLFTAPVLFVFQSAALLALPDPVPPPLRSPVLFWVETHGALSLMAFGAFGLAAVAGAVYLLQDSKLRSRHPDRSVFQLPPIADLGRITGRLMLAGFAVLTAGLLAGFGEGLPAEWIKLATGGVVWLFYAVILHLRLFQRLRPRQAALLSIAAFALALISLGGMEIFTSNPSAPSGH